MARGARLSNEADPTPNAAPEAGPAPERVGQHTRRGISWNLAGAVATNAMRLLTVVVLGRVLAPHDFGVVAAALSVTVLLHNVRDIGLGPALVQRPSLDRAHVATAFAVSLYLGLAIALLLVLAAPLLGALYRIEESVPVLRALGAIFALRGVSTVSVVLCQRAMDFRAIALVDAGAYAAGTTVAMALALRGAGPWSLVAGYLTEEALSAALYLYLRPPAVSLRISGAPLRDLLGFGAGQTVIQIAGILATYGDNFVVGRTLGAGPLGYYTRAYDLIKLPSAVFGNIVGNVLFPAFSRLQRDRARLADGFRRVMMVNALVLLPASAALIAVAPEAIRVVMGSDWDAAVLPFRILAVTMLMRTSYKVAAMVASAAGAVSAVAAANVVYMICVIVGAAVSVRWGIADVAATTAISLVVVYVHCCALAMRVSGVSATALLAAHVPGLVLAAIVGAAAWPAAVALRAAAVPAAATFAAIAVLGIALALALAWLWLRARTTGDAGWLRAELGRVRRRLR
ncbi:MAG TPA: lipopolysaccharide biosynthesis protein [Kofleriaceae bacterium]|nr:lipopolysaccharide biosynthesis protein [Kofleriaceae bacterium]